MPHLDEEDRSAFPVTARNRARRLHKRASYERVAVHAVLDAAPLCHVGYVIDGQPYVTPTIHWREGERIYWHGSAASRFLRRIEGERVCLTASLMDGYVLARSAFNHSVNYRSVMAFGRARLVEGTDEVAEALRRFTDGLFPGRWDTLRPMTQQELKATSVLFMDVEEATAKVRSAPPGDGEEAAYPVWAGVLPMETRLAPAQPAPIFLTGSPCQANWRASLRRVICGKVRTRAERTGSLVKLSHARAGYRRPFPGVLPDVKTL